MINIRWNTFCKFTVLFHWIRANNGGFSILLINP